MGLRDSYGIMPMNSGMDYNARETDIAQPVMTTPVGGNQGGDYVVQPMAFDAVQITSAANGTRVSPELPASTLAKGSRMHVAYPVQEVGKRTGASTTDPRAGIGLGQDGDPMFPLQAGAQHGVAVCATGEVFHALTSDGFDASEDGTGRGGGAVAVPMINVQGSTANAVAQADGPSYTPAAIHGHDCHVTGVTGFDS